MNLRSNPSCSDLKNLFILCDDESSHHILWVERLGNVKISPLPLGHLPISFVKSKPDMLFRYETFQIGNGYTGLKAAKDSDYITSIFNSLVSNWNKLKNYTGQDSIYIDVF